MSSSFTQILNVARSGMLARMLNMDVVSNNLANVNTTGFKNSRANFQELLSNQQLSGTQIRATQQMMDQGTLNETENALDLAISGAGFFGIRLPDDRIAYTRSGEFYLDADRQIITANGYKLDWTGEIPEGVEDIHVNPDGTLMVQLNGEWSEAGQIPLTRFASPTGLEGYGQNLWLETEASGAPASGTPNADGMGFILGSAVERSNVDMSEEMVQLINLQRSFEMSLRTFQQTDTMLSQAIQMRNG